MPYGLSAEPQPTNGFLSTTRINAEITSLPLSYQHIHFSFGPSHSTAIRPLSLRGNGGRDEACYEARSEARWEARQQVVGTQQGAREEVLAGDV